jgi:hypothetical protein
MPAVIAAERFERIVQTVRLHGADSFASACELPGMSEEVAGCGLTRQQRQVLLFRVSRLAVAFEYARLLDATSVACSRRSAVVDQAASGFSETTILYDGPMPTGRAIVPANAFNLPVICVLSIPGVTLGEKGVQDGPLAECHTWQSGLRRAAYVGETPKERVQGSRTGTGSINARERRAPIQISQCSRHPIAMLSS